MKRGLLRRTGVDPEIVGDIIIGNVLQPGSGAGMCRMAQFEAGIPYTVPLATLNRQCSSGLQVLIIFTSSRSINLLCFRRL